MTLDALPQQASDFRASALTSFLPRETLVILMITMPSWVWTPEPLLSRSSVPLDDSMWNFTPILVEALTPSASPESETSPTSSSTTDSDTSTTTPPTESD